MELVQVKAQKLSSDYCLDADENKLLIISAEELEKKQQTSAWAKALDESGIFVVEPPVNKSSIWIKAKASSLKLDLDVQAIQLLSEKNRGNLLAASQELMKLSLLFSEQNYIRKYGKIYF